jgi:lysophospholipase L1-like esterase
MLQTRTLLLIALTATAAHAQSFTCGPAKGDAIALTPATLVTDTAAGWDLKTAPTVAKGVCSSDGDKQPFYFSIPLPEGSYRVTTVLGGTQASVVTIRSEARRLMVEKLPIAAGKTVTKTFDVNTRVAEYTRPDGTPGKVATMRGRTILDWDPKLTLEFNGTNPSVRSITIESLNGAKHEPTLYLIGDSTVVDQDIEPWTAWGQQLPRFFLPGVVVSNHAESGETAKGFVSQQRIAKIMSLIQPGDYLFMQFAHNDQKPATKEPIDMYKQLLTDFINQARAKGATPVVVTAMYRNLWDDTAHLQDSLGGYPQAAREVAAATDTALIDLNAMSKVLFETMGHPGSDTAFMHVAANSYADQPTAINDNTHFNEYGAYELARCVVRGIRQAKLPIAKFLDPSVPDFDPAHPDPAEKFSLPITPPHTKQDVAKVPQT